MDKNAFIAQIKQASENFDIKPGILLKLFESVSITNGITTADLAYQLELPHTHLGRILKFFADFWQPKSHVVTLKPELIPDIKDFLASELTVDKPAFIAKFLALLETHQNDRPRAKREFDQFLATPQTVINRAIHLHNHHEIYQRNILFLGDDDLTSIAIALLDKPAKILVVDVDSDILNFIQELATNLKLPITTLHTDLRTDNLHQLSNQFDLVFTDPPYTANGINLFLDRAVAALKPKNSSSLYFCYGNSVRAPERTLAIQEQVINKKLIINSLEKNFNQYSGADSIGNGSALYSCSLTPQTKPSKSPKLDKIYTYE